MNFLRASAAAVSAALLAACGANSGGVPITSVNPTSPSYAKLQFAVGTANIYGTATGLNVVSTLRQPAGESAIGVSTPSISGPFTFSGTAAAPANGTLSDPYTTIPNSGPSLPETTASTPSITGTPQTIHPGTPFCDGTGTLPAGFTPCPSGFSPDATTFGQSGGVFAMGLAPFNAVAEQGQAYAYAPYVEPLYDNGTAHPLFLPWGGPPAFDPDGNGMGTRDGLVPLGGDSFGNPYFLGVAEGITAFEGVAAGSGTYTLNVAVATIGNGGAITVNTIAQHASMNAATLLPTIAAPQVVPDSNGDGGATFSIALPAGVSEELVQIVDWGPGGAPSGTNPNAGSAANCQGAKGTAFAPVYYTFAVTASGSYTLGPKHGPNTNQTGGISNLTPSPSICTAAQNNAAGVGNTADTITIQTIGFDYPLYEAAVSLTKPPGSVPQTPPITGSAGQADITISPPIIESPPSYTPTPLARTRSLGPSRQMRRAITRPQFIPAFTGIPQR